MSRPSWDEWALSIAAAVATRADCTRAQVGAVLLSPSHRVLSVGYNGLLAGVPGCASAGNCPRGRHARDPKPTGRQCWSCDDYDTSCSQCVWLFKCRCGQSWPCPEASAPDSNYANCPATHAERNAIEHAPADKLPGSTLYVTRKPCPACSTLVASVGIAAVVYDGPGGFRIWAPAGHEVRNRS